MVRSAQMESGRDENNNTEPGGLDRTFSGGSGRAASIFCVKSPEMPIERREPIRADAARTCGLRHAGCDNGRGYGPRACTHKSATSALPSKRTSPADHGMSVLCQKPTCGALLHQSRLAQAFGELIGIRGISKRQTAKMVRVGVSWIDLLKLAPDLPGFLGATQMAQCRCEQGAR